MIVDVLILLLIVSAIFRGREIGFVQQLFSTIGFFGGLVLGALLQPYTVSLAHSELSRSLVTLATTLGLAFLFLGIGEYLGALLKRKLKMGKADRLDNGLGSVLSVVTVLLAVWLSASVIKTLPFYELQNQVRQSKIATALSRQLPYAPDVIASLGHLVDPNGFPQVFSGGEPNPPEHINLPSSSQLLAAVSKDRESVVKIVGQGCGGVVDGSGFVVGDDMVVTNAHVVSGISRQYVQDSKGTHSATAIWFDPTLDLAILRVSNLAGDPLTLDRTTASRNTPAAVLGYPGGGGFTANPASVLNQFTATGRDIYGRGHSERSVYEVAADVEQGNSGGPLVTADGSVIGVIFARSTSYNNVGYALTIDQVTPAISQAGARNSPVSTGSCAE
ncbi:MAG: serine protease [Candidatus Saccharibacteria bacterium]|nr:serine protease [Candidatus Saccharibacteria bacterium]